MQQDKRFDYNVTLRGLRITTVAVEYLQVLNVMTACVYSCLIHPASTTHVPYNIVISGLSCCTIFSTLSNKRHNIR